MNDNPTRTEPNDDDWEQREYQREREERAYEDHLTALAEQGF